MKAGRYYKILVDDQIVGGFIVFPGAIREYELGRIFIHADYQNQGIGKTLFNKLIENFKRTGKEVQPEAKETAIASVDVVYTLVRWNDWNLLRFFHKMGFKKGEMISLELEL